MRVNFLRASDGTALSKTFEEIAPGTYREDSYPNTFKFDSIERVVTTIEELHDFIVACSGEGLCLLKGLLDRPLSNESRATHTDATTATEWICLDVDYTVIDKSPEKFLDDLGFAGVSFIFQKSASMGIKTHQGWRGHFFLLLDSPQSPQALKQWLIRTNLSSVSLRLNIGLSASGGALLYPLDVTTCQNDKLLYITPPECKGFDDPIEDRFDLVLRAKPRATIDMTNVSAAANQQHIKERISDIRTHNGLPTKSFKTTETRGVEVLTNPDAVTVTEKKESRGFVYLNLNGGDSWGYYFPEDKPDILYNFKGEPCMYMWDVDKDIYNEYSTTQVVSTTTEGFVPFGFLYPADDTYYRGMANPGTKELSWIYATGSKNKLRDFLVQSGAPPGKGWAVDEWDLEFNPTVKGGADFDKQWVNTYKRTDYILNAKHSATAVPPIIDRVLTSVCVDLETKNYFLNWLASIFQTRAKTNTAWILQGIQGTGKGVLFTHIISPLIGRDYCHEMTMDRLDDDFNAYLDSNIILFIDEANISDSKNGDRLLSRIKNLVTEPSQHIRGIRKNAVTRPNYSNIILASNYDEIITMEVSDRRFNVAPRQEKAIQLEYDDIVQIRSELPSFADYLHSYEVDHKKVKRVFLSEARDALIHLSKTTIDSFFGALAAGDLVYFTQYLDNSIKSDLEGIRYHDFALIVNRWIESVGGETNVSRNELRMCYQYLQNTSISTTKFSRMCSKYGLDMKPVRVGTTVTRGVGGVRWQLSDSERQHHEEQKTSNVVSFKEKA